MATPANGPSFHPVVYWAHSAFQSPLNDAVLESLNELFHTMGQYWELHQCTAKGCSLQLQPSIRETSEFLAKIQEYLPEMGSPRCTSDRFSVRLTWGEDPPPVQKTREPPLPTRSYCINQALIPNKSNPPPVFTSASHAPANTSSLAESRPCLNTADSTHLQEENIQSSTASSSDSETANSTAGSPLQSTTTACLSATLREKPRPSPIDLALISLSQELAEPSAPEPIPEASASSTGRANALSEGELLLSGPRLSHLKSFVAQNFDRMESREQAWLACCTLVKAVQTSCIKATDPIYRPRDPYFRFFFNPTGWRLYPPLRLNVQQFKDIFCAAAQAHADFQKMFSYTVTATHVGRGEEGCLLISFHPQQRPA